jgi:hypothetical protein
MISFIIILVFIIFAWAFIFFQIAATGTSDDTTVDLPQQLFNMFLIIFSSFNGNYTQLERPFFILVSFFVSIVLLNLLISLIGDTYQRVQSDAIPSDNIERLDMLTEHVSLKVITSKIAHCGKKTKRDDAYFASRFRHLLWVSETEGTEKSQDRGRLGEITRFVKSELEKLREETEMQKEAILEKAAPLKDVARLVKNVSAKQDNLQYNLKLLATEIEEIKKKKKIVDGPKSLKKVDEEEEKPVNRNFKGLKTAIMDQYTNLINNF